MEALVKYKWIDHDVNIIFQFANFWKQELFTDCTILCGGKKFPAHRLVLASCSEYFKEVFDDVQCCHPIIIMKDISSENLQILLDYIYQVNLIIPQKKLRVITEEGRALKIKGFVAPIKLVSNICSNVKSEFVENLKLLQKSLSPVVSITKLDDVHSNISMKRKAPKEWDSEKKVRKVDDFACDLKVKVTKSFVQDEDSIPSKSSESCGLENVFNASDDSDSDFFGFDAANRVQDEVAFNEERKSHVESICDDVKPDFATLTNSLYLEVLNQRQDEECLDEEIIKEEEEILPFPSEKSLLPNDSLPIIAPSAGVLNQRQDEECLDEEIVKEEEEEILPFPSEKSLPPNDSLPIIAPSTVMPFCRPEQLEFANKEIKFDDLDNVYTEYIDANKEPSTACGDSRSVVTLDINSPNCEVLKPSISMQTSVDEDILGGGSSCDPVPTNIHDAELENDFKNIDSVDKNYFSLPSNIKNFNRKFTPTKDVSHQLEKIIIKVSTQSPTHKNSQSRECFQTPKKFFPKERSNYPYKPSFSPFKSPKWSPFKHVIHEIKEEAPSPNPHSKIRVRRARPCLYCSKFYKDLKEHLTGVHKNEELVKKASGIRNMKKRKQMFDLIRKKGIELINEGRLARGERPITEQFLKGSGSKISQCGNCLGYYCARSISQHKTRCFKRKMPRNEGTSNIHSVNSKASEDFKEVVKTFHPDFETDIMTHFHQDEIYKIIVQSLEIRICGNEMYKKLRAVRKEHGSLTERVRSHMRRLALILKKFNSLPEFRSHRNYTLSEIFEIKKYNTFKKLIVDTIYECNTEENKERQLKEGAAIKYQYTVFDALVALVSFYTISCCPDAEEKVKSLKTFESHYRLNKNKIFGEITHFTLQRRAQNRKDNKIPSEEEIEAIITTSSRVINELGNEYVIKTIDNFVMLRRAVCTRLIFFNGRRPREVATLTIKQWSLAKEKAYFAPDQLQMEMSKECEVLDNFRIIFTMGKSSEASVLVPKKLYTALDMLADEEFREAASIPPENEYLFPSSKCSTRPTSGSSDVRCFVKACGISVKIKSVHVRHMIATKFGWADYPEATRKMFMRHLRHSKRIKKSIYQMPPAVATLKLIGLALLRLDKNVLNNSQEESEWEEESGDETAGRQEATEQVGTATTAYPSEHISAHASTSKESTCLISNQKLPAEEQEQLSDSESKQSDYLNPKEKTKVTRLSWSCENERELLQSFEGFISSRESYPERTAVLKFLERTSILHWLPMKERKNAIRRKLNNMKRLRRIRILKNKKKFMKM